jgi:hypothetical protein
MTPANMPGKAPANVDDIVASMEDAVRRAYALGRADAMKRVVELAQSDDPGLRAVALLGPAEPARPAPALLDAPQPSQDPHSQVHAAPEHQPVEAHEREADHADGMHEARQAAAAVPPPAPQPETTTAAPQPAREVPTSVGGFLADFFYPIGSKKR